MIRVAFILAAINEGWIGGMNYYRNLFKAIELLPDRKIAPVVFAGERTDLSFLADLKYLQIVRSRVFDLDRLNAPRVANRLLSLVTGTAYLVNRVIRQHDVAVVSHAVYDGGQAFKTIGWIPDFQHVHLPEFFSHKERTRRDEQLRAMARTCDRILLSSNSARKDFDRLAPEFAGKARVLRFASAPSRAEAAPLGELRQRYAFDRPYFYVPNQFWVHKNHQVIIDALALAKARLPDVLVLCTGATADYRNRGHFAALMNCAEAKGLHDNFRVLGVVPYRDVVGLMLGSLGVINPSLFEGWSTTVEEARALAVPMLLSDIPVHVEQANGEAAFFSPRDAAKLAEQMIAISARRNDVRAPSSGVADAIEGRRRLVAYGETYQKIVLELLGTDTGKDAREPCGDVMSEGQSR